MNSNNNEKTGRKNSFNVKQEKKMNTIIIYDLESLPEGKTVQDILDSYQSTGMLLYSSSKEGKNGGQIPRVIEVDDSSIESKTLKLRDSGVWDDIKLTVIGQIMISHIPEFNFHMEFIGEKHVLQKENGFITVVSKDVIDWLSLGSIEREIKSNKTTYISGNERYTYLGRICD